MFPVSRADGSGHAPWDKSRAYYVENLVVYFYADGRVGEKTVELALNSPLLAILQNPKVSFPSLFLLFSISNLLTFIFFSTVCRANRCDGVVCVSSQFSILGEENENQLKRNLAATARRE
jgi:hypothetical protein